MQLFLELYVLKLYLPVHLPSDGSSVGEELQWARAPPFFVARIYM